MALLLLDAWRSTDKAITDRYGGWYEGNPSRLKPPQDGEIAKV